MRRGDISIFASRELLSLYADILDELRRRQVTRSNNNPVAEYAESLAARALGLQVEGLRNKGFDASDDQGNTYEVKARRLTERNNSRMLSAIRGLDKHHFDFLVGILFNADFTIKRACIVPYEVVTTIASYRTHTNAWIVRLDDTVWDIDGVRDVTAEFMLAVREETLADQPTCM